MVFISKEKNILKTAKILPLLLNYGMRSTIDFLLFVIPKSEKFFLSDYLLFLRLIFTAFFTFRCTRCEQPEC